MVTRPSSFDRSFSLELFIGPLLSIGCRISLPSVLRHQSCTGILSAVLSVRLECILPKVIVTAKHQETLLCSLFVGFIISIMHCGVRKDQLLLVKSE